MALIKTEKHKKANHAYVIFMAALRSRCGHYIFDLWFLYLLSIFSLA